MSTIAERAQHLLNLATFNQDRRPEYRGFEQLKTPSEEQYVLRLLIEEPYSGLQLPEEYQWVLPIIKEGKINQKRIGIRHPFLYLTIRHGIVRSTGDDEWHTDGFSMRYSHVPEQNYIWVSGGYPTEYISEAVEIPSDFNPMFQNLHLFFQDHFREKGAQVESIDEHSIYAMDPYVVHRRPKAAFGKLRTFVRVSFTPIEIVDRNNSFNPAIPRNYTRDGVEDFRNRLFRYS